MNNINPSIKINQLNDEEFFKSLGLKKFDYTTGEDGYTVASVLLFGKDEVIKNILPYYRIDCLVRLIDTDKFDDHLIITTNLIDSYDILMAFVEKHLKSNFFVENKQRINLRDAIFREVICNILIHRDYKNPRHTELLVENDFITTKNPCKFRDKVVLSPDGLNPHPKNPLIAGVFTRMGYVEELGMGVRKIYKYANVYFGKDAKLTEGEIFTNEFNLDANFFLSFNENEGLDLFEKVLQFCSTERSRSEIQNYLGIKSVSYFNKNIMKPLIQSGKLKYTNPNHPKSPKQTYIANINNN